MQSGLRSILYQLQQYTSIIDRLSFLVYTVLYYGTSFIMKQGIELSLEQKANIAIMDAAIDQMSEDQLREKLKEATRLISLKDVVIRQLIREVTGVEFNVGK